MIEHAYVVEVREIIFNRKDEKHIVAFVEMAQRFAKQDADQLSGNFKAVIHENRGEAIEMLRQHLAESMSKYPMMKYPGASLEDFKFKVSITEVENGLLWTRIPAVHGHNFDVHKFNEGW